MPELDQVEVEACRTNLLIVLLNLVLQIHKWKMEIRFPFPFMGNSVFISGLLSFNSFTLLLSFPN